MCACIYAFIAVCTCSQAAGKIHVCLEKSQVKCIKSIFIVVYGGETSELLDLSGEHQLFVFFFTSACNSP